MALLLAVMVALSASPALAARGHLYARTIGWGVLDGKAELQTCTTSCKPGIAGSGNGQFKEPDGVAVNEATEDFYVVDKGNNRVEHFSAAGAFLGQFNGSEAPSGQFSEPQAIAVDNSCVQRKLTESTNPTCKEADPSNGDAYVQDRLNYVKEGKNHKVIDKFDASGKYIGQVLLEEGASGVEVEGIAVDRSGNLWAAVNKDESGSKRFHEFTNAVLNVPANPPFVEAITPLFLEHGLALDAAGNFYSGVLNTAINGGAETIAKFAPSGEERLRAFVEEHSTAVATELPSNDVFVDGVTKIRRFDAEEPPSELESFGVGHLSEGEGIGLDASSQEGQLYVADRTSNDLVEFPLEPPGPPTVEHSSVSEVTANSADLQAEVNPRGAISEYHFEYGPCSSPLTCSSSPYTKAVPSPEGVVGAPFDFEGHVVSAHPQDLQAGMTYHFRALAHNEKGASKGEEEKVFTTQPAGASFALPDGRAWELVSPASKHGSLIDHIVEGVIQAASSGSALTYLTSAPTEAEPEGYSNLVQVLASRSKGGWSSKDIALPHVGATVASVGQGQEYRVFAEDLSVAIVQPFGAFVPSLSPEATEQTPFLRSDYPSGNVEEPCTSHCLTPLVKSAPHPFGEEGKCPPKIICGPHVLGASPDARHVVVEAKVGLTETPGDEGGLYESSGGVVTLVSVLPNGKPSHGSVLGKSNQVVRHAISTDGERVVWSDGEHLYLRELANETTLQLDKGLSGSPTFQTASADDSRVFFTDNGNLYAHGTEAEKATLLTETGTAEAVGVQGGIIGASDDGRYVYLVANGKLAQGAQAGNCQGSEAAGRQCNLYELHEEGGAWQAHLVAVLGGADFGDWGGATLGSVLPGLSARVSPNGRYLAFMSSQSLTGYDNRDASSGKPDQEVYEFDALQPFSATNPACASCNPTGARPVGVQYKKLEEGLTGGAGVWEPSTWIAANVPAWTPTSTCCALYQSRYLSNSGRLFFNSSDALSPQDGNGTEDVYQYEPPGIGGCQTTLPAYSPASAGCMNLISAGASREESAFLDASESGSDVFFLTSSKLVKEDFDTALDIYDAHECSASSPCIPERAEPQPPCQSESACKAPPTPQPEIFAPPASATFSGLGNILQAPAPPPAKQTNAQLLAKALKSCRAKYKHSKKRRRGCEVQARRRYPVKAKAKAKKTAAAKRTESSVGMGGRR